MKYTCTMIMGIILILCPIRMPALCTPSNPPQTDWIRISPKDEGFTVLMPGIAQGDLKVTPTPNGDVKTHIYSLRKADAYFGVVWTEYPAAVKIDQTTEFKAARNNFITAVDAKLLKEGKIDLNKVEGREFTAASDDVSFTSRIFIIGNRTYQIAVGMPKGRADKFTIAEFLASFQFVPEN